MSEPSMLTLATDVPVPRQSLGIVVQLGNFFSIRFWFGTFAGAGVIAGLMTLARRPLTTSFCVFWPLLIVSGLLFGTALYCPACGSRVKTGYVCCHRCGLDIPHAEV